MLGWPDSGQRPHRLALARERAAHVVTAQALPQHLDGDRAAELRLVGGVDGAEAAAPDLDGVGQPGDAEVGVIGHRGSLGTPVAGISQMDSNRSKKLR